MDLTEELKTEDQDKIPSHIQNSYEKYHKYLNEFHDFLEKENHKCPLKVGDKVRYKSSKHNSKWNYGKIDMVKYDPYNDICSKQIGFWKIRVEPWYKDFSKKTDGYHFYLDEYSIVEHI